MNIQEQIKILEQATIIAAKPKPRKVEDFVSDMIRRGRTLTQASVVAECTRWKGQRQKIKELYRERASRKDEKVSRQTATLA